MMRYTGIPAVLMLTAMAGGSSAWAEHRYESKHCDACRYVEGRYECRTERVLVEPGHFVEECVPARWILVWDGCGGSWRQEGGYTVRRWVDDRYELREIRVWVPGYWVCSGPPVVVAPPRHIHVRLTSDGHGHSSQCEREPRRIRIVRGW